MSSNFMPWFTASWKYRFSRNFKIASGTYCRGMDEKGWHEGVVYCKAMDIE